MNSSSDWRTLERPFYLPDTLGDCDTSQLVAVDTPIAVQRTQLRSFVVVYESIYDRVLISVNLPFTVMRIEIGDSPLFPKRDLRIRKRIENVLFIITLSVKKMVQFATR